MRFQWMRVKSLESRRRASAIGPVIRGRSEARGIQRDGKRSTPGWAVGSAGGALARGMEDRD
eukprot:CAMPEP_0174304602 /NCGR_PEP_ID=MMETSP0809-20121228/60871_1 /TAXON_ID=73025 ORGANISM="Eutreptiella gymnastica-like, Strain CCMP1594" /NCGR_SAMPLE_ID=MMETSP0809 /ASSEMBLY_ACC=CAM_ASM_000658 /LENGTH=61 /DNA_ID=CAMNT_0015410871 /DNA_START=421 /DNA_END=606 /DNA_ORIENTATION=+